MDTTSKGKRDAGNGHKSASSKLGVGVSLDSSRPGGKVYKVRVYYKGKCLNLGRFDDLLTAQICYDQAVISMTSKGCKKLNTNFPVGTYPMDNEDIQRKVDEFLARLAKSDTAACPQQPEIAGLQVNDTSALTTCYQQLPNACHGSRSSSPSSAATAAEEAAKQSAVPADLADVNCWTATYATDVAAAPHFAAAARTDACFTLLDDAPLPPAPQADDDDTAFDQLMALVPRDTVQHCNSELHRFLVHQQHQHHQQFSQPGSTWTTAAQPDLYQPSQASILQMLQEDLPQPAAAASAVVADVLVGAAAESPYAVSISAPPAAAPAPAAAAAAAAALRAAHSSDRLLGELQRNANLCNPNATWSLLSMRGYSCSELELQGPADAAAAAAAAAGGHADQFSPDDPSALRSISAAAILQHTAPELSCMVDAQHNSGPLAPVAAAAGIGAPNSAANFRGFKPQQQQQQQQQGLQAQTSIVHPDLKRRRLSDNAEQAAAVALLPAAAAGVPDQLQHRLLPEDQAAINMVSHEMQVLELSPSEVDALALTHSIEHMLVSSNSFMTLQDVENPPASAATATVTAQQQPEERVAPPAPPPAPAKAVTKSSADALQLIAACVRGLLEMNVALLGNTQECALRDALMWLSKFRQRRINNSSLGDQVALHMLGQLVHLLAQDMCAEPLPAAAGGSTGAFVHRSGALLSVEKLICALTNLNDIICQAAGSTVDAAACDGWLSALHAARLCPADDVVLQLAKQINIELTGGR